MGTGGDWNSFKTIGEESGRDKQPVTWVHYACMLVFWPAIMPFLVLLGTTLLMGKFMGRWAVFVALPLGESSVRSWIPFAILSAIGLAIGIWICIRLYRDETKERRIRRLQAKLAAEAAEKPQAPPQTSQVQPSVVITGISESPDPIERTIAASRRRL